MLKYVPNALTVLRFLLIPIIVIACVQGQYILAIAVLSISGLTDILDGTIARKYSSFRHGFIRWNCCWNRKNSGINSESSALKKVISVQL